MTMPTAEEISQVHAQTRVIANTLQNDPAVRAQYLADPVSTLTGMGLPLEAAQELAAKIAQEKEEVSGYAYDSNGVFYHDMLDDLGIHIDWSLIGL